jgi:hypothetical protein
MGSQAPCRMPERHRALSMAESTNCQASAGAVSFRPYAQA